MSHDPRDPRERFTKTADLYQKYRPSYPDELIDWILATAGLATPRADGWIADLGCGTGISSRLFAARGHRVVGIDPNRKMLGLAQLAGGGVFYVRGVAAPIPLGTGSVQLVTGAQCFHWFELGPTLDEIDRVLRPGGWACSFWNLRAPSPYNDDYDALLRAQVAEYRDDVRQRSRDVAVELPAMLRARGAELVEHEVTVTDEMTFEIARGRAHSASYVAHHVGAVESFDAELGRIFEKHAQGGVVRVPLRGSATLWRRR